MVQTEWYCEYCETKHFGNCPKMKVTMTTAKPVNNKWLSDLIKRHLDPRPEGYSLFEQAILSKLETIKQEARGCVDCKTPRCENCERLWQT